MNTDNNRINQLPGVEKGLNFVRSIYLARALGSSLVALFLGAALYQQDAPFWTYMLLVMCGLFWPHIAYLLSSRSSGRIVSEYRNLLFDAILCGFWVAAVDFNLAPSVLMFAMIGMNNAIVGAIRLLVKSLIGFLAGVAISTVLFGIHFNLFSNQLTSLACSPFLLIYPAFVGILIGNVRNRAARDEARAHQRTAEARLASLLTMSPTVLYAMEHEGEGWHTVEVTANLQRLIGYSVDEALEPHWWDNHVHPEDYHQAKQAIAQVLLGERVVCHYRIDHKSDGYRWVRDELELVHATPEQPARIIGAWLDITEKQKAAAEIHRLAYFDTLTGLPNRDLLRERLSSSLVAARQNGDFGALLLIDLDGFKTINDVHGHSIGDQVLVTTSKCSCSTLSAAMLEFIVESCSN